MPRTIVQIWFGLALLVTALSLWPGGVVSDQYHLDKLGHFGAYATLAFLPTLFIRSVRVSIGIAICLVFVGVGLEAAQYLTPGRVPSILDGLANGGGVLIGTLMGSFLQKWGPLKSAVLSDSLVEQVDDTASYSQRV